MGAFINLHFTRVSASYIHGYTMYYIWNIRTAAMWQFKL